MPSFQSAMNAIPGGGRVYYSARWLRRLLSLWRDPNRQFLAYPPGHFCSPLPNVDEVRRDHPRLSDTTTASLPGIDLNVAEQHYNAAMERTDDPGLVAFNKAVIALQLGDLRDAELHYLRCLDDQAAPPLRRKFFAFFHSKNYDLGIII